MTFVHPLLHVQYELSLDLREILMYDDKLCI
jgi:hypothetical protein